MTTSPGSIEAPGEGLATSSCKCWPSGDPHRADWVGVVCAAAIGAIERHATTATTSAALRERATETIEEPPAELSQATLGGALLNVGSGTSGACSRSGAITGACRNA